jgi:subtilisin
MKKTLLVLVLIMCLISSNLVILTVAAQSQEKVPVIVGFKAKPNANLVTSQGGEIKFQYTIIPAIACDLPRQAIDALAKNPAIAYIEDDIEVSAHVIYDAELEYSWGVDQIGSGAVHEWGNKGAGINVAVIDTGIDYRLMEFTANYKGGYDFVNKDNNPMDDNGHGTHCAGVIAAADDDWYNHPVVGVAPEANLYAVKVLNSRGSGMISTIVAGINWATNTLNDANLANDIQVISMSLGSSSGTTSLQQACDNAYNAGILVVASAGNSGDGGSVSTIGYPAAYPNVIAVGATDKNNIRAYFSSTGPQLDLVAPGVDILSTYRYVSNDGLYRDVAYMSGTSMACPHVAGTAALVFASPIDPTCDIDDDSKWDAGEVRAKLQATADKPLPEYSTKPNWYGYGLVDADGAADTSGVDNNPPVISELKPVSGAYVNTITPEISAKLTDTSGINWAEVSMTLDGTSIDDFGYDPATNVVSYTQTLTEDLYTVTLTASDTKGISDTKTWSFTVDITPPSPVTELTATAISHSQIDLSWTVVSDAVNYNIYRGDGEVFVTSSTSYSDTGLSASTLYTYKVSAVDLAGNEGTQSEQASATTQNAPVQELHVKSITVTSGIKKTGAVTNVWGIATITILDASDKPVSGVTVTGQWSGSATDTDSGTTNANGQVTFTSNQVRKSSSPLTFTLTVTNVALNGWTYNPTLNVENSDYITIQ